MPAAAEQGGPQRIVSVGGSITEILYELGVEDRIVAVDTTSLYPKEATAKPNVGYLRALSAEGVLATSPDLILLETGAGPPQAVSLIDRAGIKAVHVPSGFDVKSLEEKIRLIGEAVGRQEDAGKITRRTAADLAALEKALEARGDAPRRRVLFILLLVDGRPMAAGRATAADAMIRLAGGENVLSDTQGYKTASAEAVAALQPDVVMVVNRAGETGGGEKALDLPAFRETPAGRNGAIVNMDALYLLGFGPRAGKAAQELARKFYPDLKIGGGD